MGWTSIEGATKADVVAELTKSEVTEYYNRRVLAHTVRGNVLWAVVFYSSAESNHKYILCALLGSQRGFGWGYKDMDHTMGPVEVSCPVKYLDMLSEEELNKGFGKQWAARVRAAAATKKLQEAKAKAIKVGDVVRLTNDWEVKITAVEGKKLFGEREGRLYRIPTKMLPLEVALDN